LSLGLRYTFESRSQEANQAATGAFLIPGTDDPAVSVPLFSAPFDLDMDDDTPTWRVALDHDFSESVMGYVSYNRGYKSGGFNVLTPSNPPYKSEILDAYELGLKSESLGRRLRVNTALFYYDYSDMQVQRFEQGVPIIVNGAKSELYGLDLDLQAQVTQELSLNLGLEWMHGTFDSYPNASCAVPLPPVPPFFNGGAIQVDCDVSGNRVPYAPNFTSTVGVDYAVNFDSGTVGLSVAYAYSEDYFTEPDNFLVQESYGSLNATATWTSPGGNWSLGLFGRNLTDDVVPTMLITAGPPLGFIADYTNPPRTYGVTATYRFGAQ
jgi:outer membrane receptor protein involved in Fe transport